MPQTQLRQGGDSGAIWILLSSKDGSGSQRERRCPASVVHHPQPCQTTSVAVIENASAAVVPEVRVCVVTAGVGCGSVDIWHRRGPCCRG